MLGTTSIVAAEPEERARNLPPLCGAERNLEAWPSRARLEEGEYLVTLKDWDWPAEDLERGVEPEGEDDEKGLAGSEDASCGLDVSIFVD